MASDDAQRAAEEWFGTAEPIQDLARAFDAYRQQAGSPERIGVTRTERPTIDAEFAKRVAEWLRTTYGWVSEQALLRVSEAIAACADAAPMRMQCDPPGCTSKTWADMRESCHMTYNGGHHDGPANTAFHHGMDTVFNLLEGSFRPMAECQRSSISKEDKDADV